MSTSYSHSSEVIRMLKKRLRRDLRWLTRQARKDRRVTVALLGGLVAAWIRQLTGWAGSSWDTPIDALFALSLGLVAASWWAWLTAACLVTMSVGGPVEPVAELRRISRIARARQWAFWSLGAYVAWHTVQFATALG